MNRPFTLCLAYYGNPGMLAIQVEALARLPAAIRACVALVVVDDGSPVPAVMPKEARNLDARLYRMVEDIPWNQDACRNLAVMQAPTNWVLVTDMDHVPSVLLWERLVMGALAEGRAYTFARVNAPGREPYKPHPNSYALRRALYDRAGGYDERYRGIYGTDGAFRKRLQKVAKIDALREPLIRYSRDVQPDASTTTLTRKSDKNAAAKRAMDEAIRNSGQPDPVRGMTRWVRVS